MSSLSAAGVSRVVCVLLDGVRDDVLQELLRRGDLPNLSRWVIEPGGITTGTTVFPSTTGVAYIPFLFGRYPGPANVPGIRWFDRAGAGHAGLIDRWRSARSYCGPQAALINRDTEAGPSIFELVPESLAICTPIIRGLARGAHLMPVRRALLGIAAHFFGSYAALDRAVADTWIAVAARPWRFLFVVFPGPDGLTHLFDAAHPQVLDSCRQIDRALGDFMRRASECGEPPALFVVADHGASVVREHRDVVLELEAMGVRTIRHPMHLWRRNARAAVMVSGNGAAHVYVLDSERRAEIIEQLIRLPGVALGAYRDAHGGVVVARGHLRARLTEDDGQVTYAPLLGDPLELGCQTMQDDRELLARSLATEFPDAPRQLLQLMSSPRSGDVVLAAERGTDFRGPWELPAHRSGHGSLIADHMLVPIASSLPLPSAPVRSVDLMPTMLDALGVPIPDGLDGAAFSRLATPAGALV